eukprot:scaffold50215_cov48-Phaeocystis_antarctica.AAC.2
MKRTAVTPPSAVSAYPTSSGGGNGSSGRMATTRAATATRSSTTRISNEGPVTRSPRSDEYQRRQVVEPFFRLLAAESCPRADEQVRRLHEERDDRQHDVDGLAQAHDRAQPARGGVDLAPVHDEREKVCDWLQPVPEDELGRRDERGLGFFLDDFIEGQPLGLGLVRGLATRARHHRDEQHDEWARKRQHDGHVFPGAEVGGVVEQEVEQGAPRGCAGEEKVPRRLGLQARHLPQHCEGLSE